MEAARCAVFCDGRAAGGEKPGESWDCTAGPGDGNLGPFQTSKGERSGKRERVAGRDTGRVCGAGSGLTTPQLSHGSRKREAAGSAAAV